MNKTAEAIETYSTATKLAPNRADTHYNLGVAYYLNGDKNAAIRELEKAIELKPNYTEALHNLGIIYEKIGDTAKAQMYRDKADKAEFGF